MHHHQLISLSCLFALFRADPFRGNERRRNSFHILKGINWIGSWTGRGKCCLKSDKSFWNHLEKESRPYSNWFKFSHNNGFQAFPVIIITKIIECSAPWLKLQFTWLILQIDSLLKLFCHTFKWFRLNGLVLHLQWLTWGTLNDFPFERLKVLIGSSQIL